MTESSPGAAARPQTPYREKPAVEDPPNRAHSARR